MTTPATRKYTYQHPDGHGLGRHHAGQDLSGRPAQPPEVAGSLRAALEAMDPTDEQRGKLDAFLGASMADLDLAHGTQVELAGHAEESGQEIIAWTDGHGTPRLTTVSPETFAAYFQEA